MSKINSVNNLQRLTESLGAKKEKGNGWASWTIDCGPGRLTHTDLSNKPQATSSEPQATSSEPQASSNKQVTSGPESI